MNRSNIVFKPNGLNPEIDAQVVVLNRDGESHYASLVPGITSVVARNNTVGAITSNNVVTLEAPGVECSGYVCGDTLAQAELDLLQHVYFTANKTITFSAATRIVHIAVSSLAQITLAGTTANTVCVHVRGGRISSSASGTFTLAGHADSVTASTGTLEGSCFVDTLTLQGTAVAHGLIVRKLENTSTGACVVQGTGPSIVTGLTATTNTTLIGGVWLPSANISNCKLFNCLVHVTATSPASLQSCIMRSVSIQHDNAGVTPLSGACNIHNCDINRPKADITATNTCVGGSLLCSDGVK